MAPGPSETQRRLFGDEVANQLVQQYDYDDDYETDDSLEYDVYVDNDAQQQWDENLRQLEQAIFYVLCPILGRLIGRRTAHKLWARFVNYKWRLDQARFENGDTFQLKI